MLLLLLTVVVDSLLRRTAAYSTILLAEAFRAILPPTAGVVVLNVVVLFLKGLCSPLKALSLSGDSDDSIGYARNDDQVSSTILILSIYVGMYELVILKLTSKMKSILSYKPILIHAYYICNILHIIYSFIYTCTNTNTYIYIYVYTL